MKVSTKRLFAVMVCLVFVFTMLIGCTSNEQKPAAEAAKPAAEATAPAAEAAAPVAESDFRTVNGHQIPKFQAKADETYYMNVMVSGVEYWFPVYEMFKQCAWELGAKSVYSGTTEMDANKQIASFEQDLAKKPAGIMVHPVNGDAFVAPINKAIDSGVPVITFANDSPNSKRRVFITSDNVYEGQVCVKELAKALNDEGEIAILENPGQANHNIYMNSVKAELEKHPNMKIVASAAPAQDTTKAYNASLSFIQAHPNLKAIITPEGPDALGAAQAAKEKGGKVLVLTRDLNQQILDMIKAGEVWGAINPDQGMQGYFGMLTLFVSKHTELVDPMSDYQVKNVNPVQLPYINNGMTVVTAENADAFYWDKYLKRRGTDGIKE